MDRLHEAPKKFKAHNPDPPQEYAYVPGCYAVVFTDPERPKLEQEGGVIWLGFFSLIIGLLVLVRPDGEWQRDHSAVADYENSRHGHPSRDVTRSDVFLHGPPSGSPGDGGAV